MARLIPKTDTPQLFILGNVQLYAVLTFTHEVQKKVASYSYAYVDGVDYGVVGVGEEPIDLTGRILSFENVGSDRVTQIKELEAVVRSNEPTDFAHPELGAYRVIVTRFKIDEEGSREGYRFDLSMKRITTIRERDITQEVAEQKAAATTGTTPPTTHTVVRGESLWQIAARRYGDGRLWPRLWDANKTTLRSKKPHLIYPGEVLTIP
jgi:prophage DNA circulation protein